MISALTRSSNAAARCCPPWSSAARRGRSRRPASCRWTTSRRCLKRSEHTIPGDISMFDLTGMTALVTGASGGIGTAIAQALAAQGARLAVSGSNADKLNALRDPLGGDHYDIGKGHV